MNGILGNYNQISELSDKNITLDKINNTSTKNAKHPKKTKKKKVKDEDEEDIEFFNELYAGINNMFEDVYDEED